MPALYNLKANGLLPHQLAVVGVTRKPKSHEQFREEQSQDIRDFATVRVDDALWKELRDALYYQAGEFTDPETYRQLADLADRGGHEPTARAATFSSTWQCRRASSARSCATWAPRVWCAKIPACGGG